MAAVCCVACEQRGAWHTVHRATWRCRRWRGWTGAAGRRLAAAGCAPLCLAALAVVACRWMLHGDVVCDVAWHHRLCSRATTKITRPQISPGAPWYRRVLPVPSVRLARLRSFLSFYSLPADTVAKDIGGHADDAACVSNPQSCGEANLDVQYIMAVSSQLRSAHSAEEGLSGIPLRPRNA